MDIDNLKRYKNDYVKFWVQPWVRLSLTNSIYPEPTGELETLLIENLFKIYHSWQIVIKKMDEPFYLQPWLYEKFISKSQVVCAIKNRREYYQKVFELVENQPENGIKNSIHYNEITKDILDQYQWKLYREVQSYDLTDEIDLEIVRSFEPKQLLRKDIIWDKEHQIIEIDKIWLIS